MTPTCLTSDEVFSSSKFTEPHWSKVNKVTYRGTGKGGSIIRSEGPQADQRGLLFGPEYNWPASLLELGMRARQRIPRDHGVRRRTTCWRECEWRARLRLFL